MAKAALDPHMAEILRLGAEANLAPFESMSAPAARAAAEERFAFWNEAHPEVKSVRELDIPGPAGKLHIRLYEPLGAPKQGPCVLFMHGGCWVYGSANTHDDFCRNLVRASGMRFASLDYRTAPEHPFPAPLEDCVAALNRLVAHGADAGIDAKRVAISGDSAGANLALATCLALRDRGEPMPRAAVLLYGVYSADDDTPSYRAYGGGDYVISKPLLGWAWDQYVPDRSRRADPLAAPLHADLAGLPPIFVSAAEFDPLRDDSERLVARLVQSGVDVDYRLLRGMCHASTMMGRLLPAAQAQIAQVAEFLRSRMA